MKWAFFLLLLLMLCLQGCMSGVFPATHRTDFNNGVKVSAYIQRDPTILDRFVVSFGNHAEFAATIGECKP